MERITELFTKKLAGEASKEEISELEALINSNPGEQFFQELLNNWWQSASINNNIVGQADDNHFNYILSKANDINTTELPQIELSERKKSKYFKLKSFAIAAAIAGVVFTAAQFFSYFNSEKKIIPVEKNEIIAKKGTKSKLLLPDGTQVWLNSDSKLTYSSAFNQELREVTLEGEAYFDVVKNPKKPFIVHTSAIDIKVLGTAFDVKSYPQDATIETTLMRGSIEVKKNNEPNTSKIMLKPNEKLVYNKLLEKSNVNNISQSADNNHPLTTDPQVISISTIPKNIVDSARIETSWVYGKLLFEGETFRELAPRMERWFNVKINFINDKVANYRFRGVFENENIDEALIALELTASFKYSIKGNEVFIDK